MTLFPALTKGLCEVAQGGVRPFLSNNLPSTSRRKFDLFQALKKMATFLFIFVTTFAASVRGFSFMKNWELPKLTSFKSFFESKEKFGERKLCVITGTSSGLGKQTAKQLIEKGGYFVICACRDVDKMKKIAEEESYDPKSYKIMELDLASFSSVRKFATDLAEFKSEKPIDRVVCNAAVYQPSLPYAKFTVDGHEQQMQTNFLGHFLLINLLMSEMRKATNPRVITVGSITGNDNTVGGGGVYPVADLRDLDGLAEGGKEPIAMMDGYNFNGAKAYKDSKLAIMMITNELHHRYHKSTGITFSSIYPGCIAASPLFREKKPWFRKYFPIFMKYITGGFVGEEEAGNRLVQAITDPRCVKSGVYWSWNGGPREGRGMEALQNGGEIIGAGGAGGGWDSIYENDQSDRVMDRDRAAMLWKYATKILDVDWPLAFQPKSPCPTLKVISFVTAILDKKEQFESGKGKPKNLAEQLLFGLVLLQKKNNQDAEEQSRSASMTRMRVNIQTASNLMTWPNTTSTASLQAA